NQTLSDASVDSRCDGGDAYTCYNNAPWAVSPTLAYGYVALHSGSGDHCGRCYQFQFKGTGQHSVEDPGSQALNGKTMIVQATNVGVDVSANGQFDLLVPGGGYGAMENGCTRQWNVTLADQGDKLGGFLTTCKNQHGNNHSQ